MTVTVKTWDCPSRHALSCCIIPGMNVSELPDFVERSEGRVQVLLRASLAEELLGLGIINPAKFLSGCGPTEYAGRMTPLRVNLGSGETAIVRVYRRGGMARCLMAEKYLGYSRPFREVVVSEHLRGRGVPTVEVLAAVCVRELGVMHSGFIVTREALGAETIRDVLSKEGNVREMVTSRVPEIFRALHDAGVAHHDLTVDNVIVGGDGAVLLVDLDGCRVSRSVSMSRKMADLLRFRRSVHKNNIPVSEEQWRQFLRSYARSDDDILGQEDAWLAAFERRLFWYKLGWKLGL